ncbi:hypothetical protein BY996DRAFT_829589 [Phakopsora pachyrhizi]|nr:hypothetical protein BY996DRAFT_829589 [Phakopsora pachyrhizi]
MYFNRQTSRSTKIDKAAANLKQILSSQEFTKARDDNYNQEDLTSENKSCGNRSQLYFGATTAAINKKQKKNIESQLKGLESGKKVIKILKRDNLINDSQTFKQKSTSENKVFDGSCAEKIPKGACLTNVDSEVEFEDLESLVKLLPQGLNFTEEVLKNILLAYGTSSSSSLGFLNLLVFGGSVGDISGAMGQNSGFFDEMASYSGGLVEGSQSHENLIGIVPKDRMSVWSYWWGFEISIPQPSMKNLESKKSISATVLVILIGLASSSGIIEILPVLKYLSNYLDLEWKAVQSQNKGNGVVIAATWVLPMILIPRPWDFDNQQN